MQTYVKTIIYANSPQFVVPKRRKKRIFTIIYFYEDKVRTAFAGIYRGTH